METNESTEHSNQQLNERVENHVPDELIYKRAGEAFSRHVTVYDFIACHIGLTHVHKDIYRNQNGMEFIRTKYGFRPSIQYNLSLRVWDLKRQVEELEYKVKLGRKEVLQAEQELKLYIEKSKEKIRKAKSVFEPLSKENKRLRQELKALRMGLKQFMQMEDSVIDRLIHQCRPNPAKDEVAIADLPDHDWAAYLKNFDDSDEVWNEGDVLKY
jgi:hypothetical protein